MTFRSFIRRALVEFDIAGNIPAGSTIDSVTLTLNANLTPDTLNRNMSLFTRSPGLGRGNAGLRAERRRRGPRSQPRRRDLARRQVPAGALDQRRGRLRFVERHGIRAADRLRGVGQRGPAPGLLVDVQSWFVTPAGNEGWLIQGDETQDTTTRRFYSREGAVPPVLVVDFTPPAGHLQPAVSG